MNWTQIEGKWDQLKGDVKSKWAKLTDDDIKFVHGKFDNLVGKVVERYGVKKEQAHHQVSEWADRLGAKIEAAGRAMEEHHGEPHGEKKPDEPPRTTKH